MNGEKILIDTSVWIKYFKPKLSDSTIEAFKIVIPAEAGIQEISQEPGFLFSQE